jgi:hypothetical protein
MATTTNYGWTTPDDTALVKDGAAAIRTLGTSIDTTTFNNASAAIAKTIVDAKGDIIAATAADTVSRLAVGTNGQYLSADSTTATGLKWDTVASGGLTLLSTTTLSGTSTTISSISGAYTNLEIVYLNVLGSANQGMNMRFNGDDGANYFNCSVSFNTYEANVDAAATSIPVSAISTNNTPVQTYSGTITIPRYATGTSKFVQAWSIGKYSTFSPDARLALSNYNSSSAISSITFTTLTGTTFSAGTVYIYGAK